MATVKLRIVYGSELELEGEADDVGVLLDRLYAPTVVSSAGVQRVDNLSTTLTQLAFQADAATETEWVLVYALGVGKTDFTRQDLLEAYRQSHRYSENRRKNLSFNLKTAVKRGWLNVTGATTFSLSPEGRAKAEELVARGRKKS